MEDETITTYNHTTYQQHNQNEQFTSITQLSITQTMNAIKHNMIFNITTKIQISCNKNTNKRKR